MSGDLLFSPKAAGTVNISATTSSQRVALVNGTCTQIRVKNIDGTNVAFVNFGDSTVTAAAASGVPIGPGETAGFTIPSGFTHAAAITGTSTATVYFTPGNGL